MNDIKTPPGRAEVYVLRGGEGLTHLVAGQVIRTVAGTADTAGGFGAVTCDCPRDQGPIPMHWHEREHDTWFVTRGKLQVWCKDESRVLSPGDFAYVRPGDTHSYQSVAPRTAFFGVVAPGGWEQFFADAGEVWGMTGLPPADRPFDFSRMGPAMGKHRIMRVPEPVYADATPLGSADQDMPSLPASYYLEAGFGRRRVLSAHLSTAILTAEQSGGVFDMRVIEAGQGAAMPAMRHSSTHLFLYVLEGVLRVSADDTAYELTSGDCINLPAGTRYATEVKSGSARWLATSSGGDGATFWDKAGSETADFLYPLQSDPADKRRLGALSGVDAALA